MSGIVRLPAEPASAMSVNAVWSSVVIAGAVGLGGARGARGGYYRTMYSSYDTVPF